MRRPALLIVTLLSVTTACRDDPSVGSVSSTTVPAAATTAITPTTTSTITSTTSSSPTTDAVGTVVPTGFDSVRATVTDADGTVCELCLWLADSGERRSQGLMSVTDLGTADGTPDGAAVDGMAFVYPLPHSGNFWMKNTVLPLSIAFFGIGGTYLGAFDMEPCTEEPCPLYPTPDDFLVAVETTRGDLGELGIGPGSVLELTDLPCD